MYVFKLLGPWISPLGSGGGGIDKVSIIIIITIIIIPPPPLSGVVLHAVPWQRTPRERTRPSSPGRETPFQASSTVRIPWVTDTAADDEGDPPRPLSNSGRVVFSQVLYDGEKIGP